MRATIGLALMSMWFGVASASAETHRFTPSTFYNTFSFAHPPALRIKPGDRVITVTIDAFGNDASDRRVASAPNPQTGPFFVEGAEPGDMLVVTLNRIEPNRGTAPAMADERLRVPRADRLDADGARRGIYLGPQA